MNRAAGADVVLVAGERSYALHLDLRFRTAHASGGLIREAGSVANLPSGEAYIVPYEGERKGEMSMTAGLLPVQFGNEVVVFRVEGNRAVEASGGGVQALTQARMLKEEPAYGNLAELGIGVLGEWGVKPVGSTLLDEKLGLHIAFGRSEHFGGITGPENFGSPQRVVHIDWVYVPEVQPAIAVKHVSFTYEDGSAEVIMKDGGFVPNIT
jgi:leucyl aminopeptidase (aminopeptidase T)